MSGLIKINKIFIILTPFHKQAFWAKYGDEMTKNNVLILKDKNIENVFFLNYNSKILTLPDINFSVFKFQEGFFKTLYNYRNKVKVIQNYCDQLVLTTNFENKVLINIGTDRDVFTQIFLNKIYNLKKFQLSLFAFDEGLGYYDTKTFTDKIKKLVYPILSPLLFNEKLRFYKPMGHDRRIDKVYCRFPDLISKNGFSTYENLNVRENNNTGTYNTLSKKALVFSFPNQDLNIKDEVKIVWISEIQKIVNTKEFIIKLHPREKIPDLEKIALEKKWILIEEASMKRINYFDYKYIINFYSSVVIDILKSGYPADKIITIDFGNTINLSSLYDKTTKIKIKNLYGEDKIRL